MSVAVAPVLPTTQPDVQQSLFNVGHELAYTELDRKLDRALCKQYFQIWLRFQGTPELHEQPLTFAQFEAAADRLGAVGQAADFGDHERVC